MLCGSECPSNTVFGNKPDDFCPTCPRLPDGMTYGVGNALKNWPENGEGRWPLGKVHTEDLPPLNRGTLNRLEKRGWARRTGRPPSAVLTKAGKAKRQGLVGVASWKQSQDTSSS